MTADSAYDLLIYNLGKHDLQWMFKDEHGQLCRKKAGFGRDELPIIKRHLLDKDENPKFTPNSHEYREVKPREYTPDDVLGFGFPIFTKTLLSLASYYDAYHPKENQRLTVLFVNYNRRKFCAKEFGSRLQGTAKKAYNGLKKHLETEANVLTDVLIKHWCMISKAIATQIRDMRHQQITSWSFLELGATGFYSEDEVIRNPTLLDMNSRDNLYPYLSKVIMDHPAVKIDISYMSAEGGCQTKKGAVGDLIKDARHCFITTSTGLGVVNQILQTIVAGRRYAAHPGNSPSPPPILVPQLEKSPQTPDQASGFQFRPFFPYETFMEVRRMLCELYTHKEFQTAQMYLQALPEPVKSLDIIKAHLQFNACIVQYLNYSATKKVSFSDMVKKSVRKLGIGVGLLNNPIFRHQQKVAYEMVKKRYSDAVVSLGILRDVVVRKTLNYVLPNCVNNRGFLINDNFRHLYSHTPSWFDSKGTTARKGTTTPTLPILLHLAEKSRLGSDKKPILNDWLIPFWQAIQPVQEIRNKNVHEGLFEKADRNKVIGILYQNPDSFETEPGNIDFFNNYGKIASEKKIDAIFPRYQDLWQPISQAGLDNIEKFPLSALIQAPWH